MTNHGEHVVYPTHTCFDDALEFICERVKREPALADTDRLLLVHAICLKEEGEPDAGKPFAHAWVEEGDRIWMDGILDGERITYSAQAAEILAALRVQALTRYTVRQAWGENSRSGHYGPWVEAYEKLCNDNAPRKAAGL